MKTRALLAGLSFAALTLAAAPASAQDPFDDYEAKPVQELLQLDVSYDEAIPLPEDVTGKRIGDWIYPPEMIHDYMRAVAEASDRVSVDVIGRAHSGRPLMRVTITSPENHDRLEDIREAHLNWVDPDSDAELSDDQPVVIQYTHGVHGTEPSGYDAIPPLLYFLSAAQGAEVEDMLDNTVIHLIGPINPDGASRFANWANSNRGAVPVADPQTREHFGEWPWGRYNHYLFDLNRQWLPATQPEVRALIETTRRWMPNVATDFHEMGENSSYFFSPGPPDQLHPLLSDGGLALNQEMNSYLEDQLDSEGALYVSEENFDDFYLGYGSSYPGLLGAVPYLFEQSSVRGLIQETDRGVLRHDDKVGQQARVGLALIRSALANREGLLRHQRDFYAESGDLAADAGARGYVFTSHDRSRLAQFVDLMTLHGVEVRELNQTTRVDDVTYEPESSVVVEMDQREFRVAEAMFELTDTGEMTAFYDVSGWTQPLAYDLDWAPLRGGLFSPNLAGDRIESFDAAPEAPEQADYAYVIEWDEFYAPRTAHRLLRAGLNVWAAPDAIELETVGGGTVEPGRGALIVPVANQTLSSEDIHAFMTRAAEEDGAVVHAAATGATPTGSDLGGFSLTQLEEPKILLLTGRDTSASDVGEIWHLLDHEMRMPVSMIDVSEIGSSDIDGYTHMILAQGRYGDLDSERIGEWVRGGGTLIGVRGGASWAVSEGLADVTMTRTKASDAETGDTNGERAEAEPLPYDDIDDWDSEQTIAGAIFETSIDITHPLLFGYADSTLPVHRVGLDAFVPGDSPFSQPVRYVSGGLMSGYASEQSEEELAGKGAMHAQRSGSGAVILFADAPYYRAYFKGSSRMLTNALFFSDAFRDASRRAD